MNITKITNKNIYVVTFVSGKSFTRIGVLYTDFCTAVLVTIKYY